LQRLADQVFTIVTSVPGVTDAGKRCFMTIVEKISAYHGRIAGSVPWRYRSWEHCFGFFRRISPAGIAKESYQAYGQPTDTLVTKIILGTFGCLPACDRLFIVGFTREGFKYSYLNRKFVNRILQFCHDNSSGLRAEQARIKAISGLHYPLMKLVDMYFWQIGYESSAPGNATGTEPPPFGRVVET